MIYAQTTCFYVLGTAAAAGILCCILSTAENVIKEIFCIVLAGMIAGILIPILLKYILIVAAVLILWRLWKDTRKSIKKTESLIEETWEHSRPVTALREKRHIQKLQKIRQQRRQAQLNKEIRAIERQRRI